MKENNLAFQKILDDRFGMFVHFGIYSAMAGSYNGRKCEWLGEWIQQRLEIPIAEYEAFGRKYFCPAPDFAKNLVASAKKAGIKYIVLTSKHHDGFCLFKSEYTDYSTYGFFGRDICKELSDECKKQGMGLGFYYSHTLDWYEKDAGGNMESSTKIPQKNRNYWDYPDDNIKLEKYLYEKCFPQVKELLTNYGDLKIIWFDYPHDISKEQSQELRALVKSLQPDCQINSRIAHNCNDYESLGDNALPVAPVGVNMECLITLNDTWGYKAQDNNWKTPDDVCGILCRTLGSNASLLLNVGPKGDGSLTRETEDILEKMGEWTARNSEAVYGGIKGNPFPNIFSWGQIGHKDKNMYLYIRDKSQKEIKINIGAGNEVEKVSVIGLEEEVRYSFVDGVLTITQTETELMMPVYKIEFKNQPDISKEIVQHGGKLFLGVLWANKVEKGNENGESTKLFYEKGPFIDDYGKHGLCVGKDCQASFWQDSNEVMCWDAYFTEAGEYEASLTHAYTFNRVEQREEYCDYTLTVDGTSQSVNMKEEKRRFYLSKTTDVNTRIVRDAGVFKIDKPGKYRILLSKPEPGDDMRIENVEFDKIK